MNSGHSGWKAIGAPVKLSYMSMDVGFDLDAPGPAPAGLEQPA